MYYHIQIAIVHHSFVISCSCTFSPLQCSSCPRTQRTCTTCIELMALGKLFSWISIIKHILRVRTKEAWESSRAGEWSGEEFLKSLQRVLPYQSIVFPNYIHQFKCPWEKYRGSLNPNDSPLSAQSTRGLSYTLQNIQKDLLIQFPQFFPIFHSV